MEATASLGRRSVIASPEIELPSSPSASGASKSSNVSISGVFHCQATEATLNPWLKRKPSPGCSGSVSENSGGVRFSAPGSRLRPRLGTSITSAPLPADGS